MNIFKAAQAIYTDHILAAGKPGESVKTNILPFLMERYGIDSKQATKVRKQAVDMLEGAGMIRRANVQATVLQITRVQAAF
jgi:hypothetical protein